MTLRADVTPGSIYVTLFSKEVPLSFDAWVRRIHRWVSIAFTVTVVVNIAVMTQQEPPAWVTYSPLPLLVLLLLTGLYLFVLPYVAKWRSGRRAS